MSREGIKRSTGFSLATMLPHWKDDDAALATYHDEHERLVKELGWENVIGSLFVHEDQLVLGVFVRKARTIDGEIAPSALPHAQRAIENGEAAELSS